MILKNSGSLYNVFNTNIKISGISFQFHVNVQRKTTINYLFFNNISIYTEHHEVFKIQKTFILSQYIWGEDFSKFSSTSRYTTSGLLTRRGSFSQALDNNYFWIQNMDMFGFRGVTTQKYFSLQRVTEHKVFLIISQIKHTLVLKEYYSIIFIIFFKINTLLTSLFGFYYNVRLLLMNKRNLLLFLTLISVYKTYLDLRTIDLISKFRVRNTFSTMLDEWCTFKVIELKHVNLQNIFSSSLNRKYKKPVQDLVIEYSYENQLAEIELYEFQMMRIISTYPKAAVFYKQNSLIRWPLSPGARLLELEKNVILLNSRKNDLPAMNLDLTAVKSMIFYYKTRHSISIYSQSLHQLYKKHSRVGVFSTILNKKKSLKRWTNFFWKICSYVFSKYSDIFTLNVSKKFYFKLLIQEFFTNLKPRKRFKRFKHFFNVLELSITDFYSSNFLDSSTVESSFNYRKLRCLRPVFREFIRFSRNYDKYFLFVSKSKIDEFLEILETYFSTTFQPQFNLYYTNILVYKKNLLFWKQFSTNYYSWSNDKFLYRYMQTEVLQPGFFTFLQLLVTLRKGLRLQSCKYFFLNNLKKLEYSDNAEVRNLKFKSGVMRGYRDWLLEFYRLGRSNRITKSVFIWFQQNYIILIFFYYRFLFFSRLFKNYVFTRVLFYFNLITLESFHSYLHMLLQHSEYSKLSSIFFSKFKNFLQRYIKNTPRYKYYSIEMFLSLFIRCLPVYRPRVLTISALSNVPSKLGNYTYLIHNILYNLYLIQQSILSVSIENFSNHTTIYSYSNYWTKNLLLFFKNNKISNHLAINTQFNLCIRSSLFSRCFNDKYLYIKYKKNTSKINFKFQTFQFMFFTYIVNSKSLTRYLFSSVIMKNYIFDNWHRLFTKFYLEKQVLKFPVYSDLLNITLLSSWNFYLLWGDMCYQFYESNLTFQDTTGFIKIGTVVEHIIFTKRGLFGECFSSLNYEIFKTYLFIYFEAFDLQESLSYTLTLHPRIFWLFKAIKPFSSKLRQDEFLKIVRKFLLNLPCYGAFSQFTPTPYLLYNIESYHYSLKVIFQNFTVVSVISTILWKNYIECIKYSFISDNYFKFSFFDKNNLKLTVLRIFYNLKPYSTQQHFFSLLNNYGIGFKWEVYKKHLANNSVYIGYFKFIKFISFASKHVDNTSGYIDIINNYYQQIFVFRPSYLDCKTKLHQSANFLYFCYYTKVFKNVKSISSMTWFTKILQRLLLFKLEFIKLQDWFKFYRALVDSNSYLKNIQICYSVDYIYFYIMAAISFFDLVINSTQNIISYTIFKKYSWEPFETVIKSIFLLRRTSNIKSFFQNIQQFIYYFELLFTLMLAHLSLIILDKNWIFWLKVWGNSFYTTLYLKRYNTIVSSNTTKGSSNSINQLEGFFNYLPKYILEIRKNEIFSIFCASLYNEMLIEAGIDECLLAWRENFFIKFEANIFNTIRTYDIETFIYIGPSNEEPEKVLDWTYSLLELHIEEAGETYTDTMTEGSQFWEESKIGYEDVDVARLCTHFFGAELTLSEWISGLFYQPQCILMDEFNFRLRMELFQFKFWDYLNSFWTSKTGTYFGLQLDFISWFYSSPENDGGTDKLVSEKLYLHIKQFCRESAQRVFNPGNIDSGQLFFIHNSPQPEVRYWLESLAHITIFNLFLKVFNNKLNTNIKNIWCGLSTKIFKEAFDYQINLVPLYNFSVFAENVLTNRDILHNKLLNQFFKNNFLISPEERLACTEFQVYPEADNDATKFGESTYKVLKKNLDIFLNQESYSKFSYYSGEFISSFYTNNLFHKYAMSNIERELNLKQPGYYSEKKLESFLDVAISAIFTSSKIVLSSKHSEFFNYYLFNKQIYYYDSFLCILDTARFKNHMQEIDDYAKHIKSKYHHILINTLKSFYAFNAINIAPELEATAFFNAKLCDRYLIILAYKNTSSKFKIQEKLNHSLIAGDDNEFFNNYFWLSTFNDSIRGGSMYSYKEAPQKPLTPRFEHILHGSQLINTRY